MDRECAAHSGHLNHVDGFFNWDWDEWLHMNVFQVACIEDRILEFTSTCWVIWCSRNKEVIQGKLASSYSQCSQLKDLLIACKQPFGDDSAGTYSQQQGWISWAKPPRGFIKVSADGSSLVNLGKAGMVDHGWSNPRWRRQLDHGWFCYPSYQKKPNFFLLFIFKYGNLKINDILCY